MAGSAQREADEQTRPPPSTTIFSIPLLGVIKGYSEPLKMPSIFIENEIEPLSLKRVQEQSSLTGWPEQGALADKDGFVKINK